MFDRFTDRARKAMWLARDAAMRHGHDYIAPEHMLLGVLETNGVGTDALKALNVPRRKLAAAVEKRLPAGVAMVTAGQLPFTPRAKTVLERSLEEAHAFEHNYICTEHLLLGLMRDEGNAGTVLREAGLDADSVREEIGKLLGQELGKSEFLGSSALVLASDRMAADEVVRAPLAAAGFEHVTVVNPVGFDAERLADRCAAVGLAVIVEPDSAELVYAAGLCRGARTPTIVFSAGADGLPSPLASLPVVSTADELRDILR